MVSQLLVSKIKLEATLDLTQTSMRLSLGSCADFVFPHLEGLMSLNSCTLANSKEPVIPIFRMDQGRLELTIPEVKAGTEASSGNLGCFLSRNYTISSTQQEHTLRVCTFGNNSKNYSNRWCHNSVYPK